MCKYPVFMALGLLERVGRGGREGGPLHLVPRLLWGRKAALVPGDHHCHSSIPRLKDKGTFSLQIGLSPAYGTASTGKAVGCELERSQKNFRKVCDTSGAFPTGDVHGRHMEYPKPLSTSSRSGNHSREACSPMEELMHQLLLLTP